MPGKSRWFVGSSSNSRSGRRTSSRARDSRLRQPPEQNVGRLVGVAEADLREGDGGAGLAFVVFEMIVGEGGEEHVADGLAGGENVVLGEVAEAGGAAQRTDAGVGLLASGQQAQEGRFAGAVRPDEADALAGAEVEGQVGEQRPRAVALGQPLHAQQDGHARPRSRDGGRRRGGRPRVGPLLMLRERGRRGKGSRPPAGSRQDDCKVHFILLT